MGLAERLRDISGFLSESEEATKTCAEAADEIERLRAQNTVYRGAIETILTAAKAARELNNEQAGDKSNG